MKLTLTLLIRLWWPPFLPLLEYNLSLRNLHSSINRNRKNYSSRYNLHNLLVKPSFTRRAKKNEHHKLLIVTIWIHQVKLAIILLARNYRSASTKTRPSLTNKILISHCSCSSKHLHLPCHQKGERVTIVLRIKILSQWRRPKKLLTSCTICRTFWQAVPIRPARRKRNVEKIFSRRRRSSSRKELKSSEEIFIYWLIIFYIYNFFSKY